MRRQIRAFQRLMQTRGLQAALTTTVSYLWWRLSGSPPASGPPRLEHWLGAYGDLMPDRLGDATFSIVCPVHDTRPDLLAECVLSVLDQRYDDWELILVDDASTKDETVEELEALASHDARIRVITLPANVGIAAATNEGIDAAGGDYLVFLDHDDRLAPSALAWLSSCTPSADLIYSDEDKIDLEGNHSDPFFKPAWSPRLLTCVNYVNHVTCVRTGLVRELGGLRTGIDGVQDHDLLLRLAERPLEVAHLPNVLYHWRAWSESVAENPSSKLEVEARGLQVVQEAIQRRGWNAHAALGNGAPFNYRVVFDPEPTTPFVKVVIPTRDRVELLERAVDGVLTRTDGVEVVLVIVDNGSRRPRTLAYLDRLRSEHDNVFVHTIDDAFNFSRLCNEGARSGPDAPLLLLLNNDVEIQHRDWLLQLTGWLRDPEVIGVGAKLLFPDGTIQHGGVIVGFGGIAGHYAGYQPNQPQLGNLHDQAREVGCLTAACLLVRSADYHKVGGMREELAVDFQDVDFCLRLRSELGGHLVYDPTYPLLHAQSASRGTVGATSGYTVARMRFLWGRDMAGLDPYYNPHLSLSEHDFSLAPLPAVESERADRLLPRASRGE
jgi:O-antigen biosynthesis protein